MTGIGELDPAPSATPTFTDILSARNRISPFLQPTPLYNYPRVDAVVGTQVWIKHENHQPVGAFKVRGGINLIAQLSKQEREAGVIAASTGNHGLSIAFAANRMDVDATIVVPEAANPVKVAAIQALDAAVVAHGQDYDAAREHAECLATSRHLRYIHSGNESQLIAGVGTLYLEMFEQQPNLDTIIVPVGGGSGAAAACIVTKAIRPSARIIGVQSSNAPAAYQSWRARRLLTDRMATFAEGLATRTAFALPQRILWELLDDFVLVADEDLRRAMRLMIELTSNAVEAAGAASLAGALALRDRLAGLQVALVASGGNVVPAQLADICRDPA